MTKQIRKFLYFGVMSWIYSIIVQTPFAIWVWHMSWDQYVAWVWAGIPITFVFFGWAIKSYLDFCGRIFDDDNEGDNECTE